MELMNERQRFPFAFACALTFLIIAVSYLITHIASPAPALSNRFFWYMARSAGMTSYGLLSLVVLLGVSTTSTFWDKWKLRKLMNQMHQYAALLIFPFLIFHLWGLHQDTSVPFRWLTLLVPFMDHYRPIPTGFGILTLYGMVVLMITAYARKHVGVKLWRTIHYASFPMFIMVTLHGLLAGTDSKSQWAMLVYLIPSSLFTLFVWKRLRRS